MAADGWVLSDAEVAELLADVLPLMVADRRADAAVAGPPWAPAKVFDDGDDDAPTMTQLELAVVMRTDAHVPGPFDRPEWHERAACKGKADLMFPEPGADTSAAVALCAGCPVRFECRGHAVAAGEEFGVWGGRPARGTAAPVVVTEPRHTPGVAS